jgi:hypothetical protein
LVTLSGLAGTQYRLRLTGSEQLASVSGALRDRTDEVLVEMPAGAPGAYVSQEVSFRLQ